MQKRFFIHTTIILLALFSYLPLHLMAQPVKTMIQSVVNGASTGAVVSTGAWLAENDGDPLKFDQIAFGIGAGILGGIGSGLLDVVQSEGKSSYALKGTFNISRNRAGIILMDTFYGAGAGLILSGAFTLMAEDKNWSGLREGMGVGTWFGFGFGMVDAFILAKQTSVSSRVGIMAYQSENTKGLNMAIGVPQKMPVSLQQHKGASPFYLSMASMRINF